MHTDIHIYMYTVCTYISSCIHILHICMLFLCDILGKLFLHNMYIFLYVSYGNCGVILETLETYTDTFIARSLRL